MAHYDCKNCGVYGGIDFGHCESCTPPEYFRLEKRKREVESEIKNRVEERVIPLRNKIQEEIAEEYSVELAVIRGAMEKMEKTKS
jgi:hypothetical protein